MWIQIRTVQVAKKLVVQEARGLHVVFLWSKTVPSVLLIDQVQLAMKSKNLASTDVY